MALRQSFPSHPGGFIRRNYMVPFGLGSNAVAEKLGVSQSTFNRLINEKSEVTSEMALRLSRVLGRSPESWLLMQTNFNLSRARDEVDLSRCTPINFNTLKVVEE